MRVPTETLTKPFKSTLGPNIRHQLVLILRLLQAVSILQVCIIFPNCISLGLHAFFLKHVQRNPSEIQWGQILWKRFLFRIFLITPSFSDFGKTVVGCCTLNRRILVVVIWVSRVIGTFWKNKVNFKTSQCGTDQRGKYRVTSTRTTN